jgi:hypothetical protein
MLWSEELDECQQIVGISFIVSGAAIAGVCLWTPTDRVRAQGALTPDHGLCDPRRTPQAASCLT